jgi:predicted DCC family thiol-disulfide oxidoreductase YuxK
MTEYQIILFDGVCNFCNFWVNFILDRDKNDLFRFTALQSERGQDLLKRFRLDTANFDSFLLIAGNKYYTKSTAALMISKNLKGLVKILYPFIFLPKFLRDFFYDLIAKNRYKLFDKREVCRVPTEEERKKFL